MLEGKTVNLKMIEKDDLPLLVEWFNQPEFTGRYDILTQSSKTDMEKMLDRPDRPKSFFIQKKDGTKVGFIQSRDVVPSMSGMCGLSLGYCLLPSERGKGYCTEAVNLLLDYLFLSTAVVRIEAHTDVRNLASQKVLEKAGFSKEGVIRKGMFAWGEWRDGYLYSVLREDWKEPKILTKTA